MELWIPLVTLLTSGIGAYFGAYLKKKGENLATHEDIDKLVQQVSAVTTTTKEIEAKISNEVWDRQKRWELKRDTLFETAKKMSRAQNGLSRVYAVHSTNKRSNNWENDPVRLTKTNDALKVLNDAADEFEGVILLLTLVCDKEVVQEARKFILFSRNLGLQISEGKPEEYEKAIEEIVAKGNAVLTAIRKELAQ